MSNSARCLALSIGLNLLLLTGAAFLWCTRGGANRSGSGDLEASDGAQKAGVIPVEDAARTGGNSADLQHELPAKDGSVKAFRWSQIESPDLSKYIANLRAIECPEGIIRDVITTAVGKIYEAKRVELMAKMPGSPGSAAILQVQNRLRSEENDLVESLLGEARKIGKVHDTLDGKAIGGASNDDGPPAKVFLPVVLLDSDSKLFADPARAAKFQSMRQEFAQTIGVNQDPSDPEYLRRWNEARTAFDAQFQAVFGTEEFQKLQTRAVREGMAN